MRDTRLSVRASTDDLARWRAAAPGDLASWVRAVLDSAAAGGANGRFALVVDGEVQPFRDVVTVERVVEEE